MELETLLEIGADLGYFQSGSSNHVLTAASEIGKMLVVLRSRLAQPALK